MDDPPATPLIEYRPSGLPRRKHHLPARYRDELPPVPTPVAPAAEPAPDDAIDLVQHDIDPEPQVVRTQPNEYGVYREYIGKPPSYTPDDRATLADLCNSPELLRSFQKKDPDSWWTSYARTAQNLSSETYFSPFPNPSTYRLMVWFHGLSNLKSHGELNRLVKDVILADDFRPEDLKRFSADKEVRRLDLHQDDASPIFAARDGWYLSSIAMNVPCEQFKHKSEAAAPVFNVEGLYYRKLTDVVKSTLRETITAKYHIFPYKEYYKPSSDHPPVRIYSEIYTAEGMLEEHARIQSQSHPCDLERFIIPILLYSDSTHFTSFGNASLWPMYMYIGNLTKYTRCKPSSLSAHHVAYIPMVQDFEFYVESLSY